MIKFKGENVHIQSLKFKQPTFTNGEFRTQINQKNYLYEISMCYMNLHILIMKKKIENISKLKNNVVFLLFFYTFSAKLVFLK